MQEKGGTEIGRGEDWMTGFSYYNAVYTIYNAPSHTRGPLLYTLFRAGRMTVRGFPLVVHK